MTGSMTTLAADSAPRIRALASVLSNQIAAGEVVERPASVVKELIENSFDASARRVHVEAEAGGIALVRVRDDGYGIHAEDLKLALSRHATSKIATLSDLEQVKSFGFRGEALPSIASVSRLTLASRTADRDTGFEVMAEGAAAQTLRPAALPPGTLVTVRDLFFNTPARRKFLRTERTELRHLEDVVKRAALARFDVALSFHHNGKTLFRLPPAVETEARRLRIARLLGTSFAEGSLEVEIEGSGMTLKGWLSAPVAARAHADLQYLFINGRAVRDSTVRHAVRQAFGERLASGRHPAYVLYLELDPSQLDVNVHPAKHEVRFRESRLVHDFVWRALARALDDALALPPPGDARAVAGAAVTTEAGQPLPATDARTIGDFVSAHGVREESETPAPWISGDLSGLTPGRSPTVIAGRYGVSVDSDGVDIVDLAQTRRVMIREDLLARTAQSDAVSRPLLLPLSISVEETLADTLESRIGMLSIAGFELRRSAPGSVTLRAVPACLAHVPASALLDTIIRWAQGAAEGGRETLAEALARIGGEHLEDLGNEPQQLSALLRFIKARSGEDNAHLITRLDAAAVAALLKR